MVVVVVVVVAVTATSSSVTEQSGVNGCCRGGLLMVEVGSG